MLVVSTAPGVLKLQKKMKTPGNWFYGTSPCSCYWSYSFSDYILSSENDGLAIAKHPFEIELKDFENMLDLWSSNESKVKINLSLAGGKSELSTLALFKRKNQRRYK